MNTDTTIWAARSVLGALLLLLLAPPADLLAQERTPQSLVEVQRLGNTANLPAPETAPVAHDQPAVSKTAALTFFTDRALFEAAFEAALGATLGAAATEEDFEDGNVLPFGINGCNGPADASSGDATGCFDPGDIEPGVSFDSDRTAASQPSLALLGPGAVGSVTKALVANYFIDAFVIDFTGPYPVVGVGFDVISVLGGTSCVVEFFGPGGLLGTAVPACNAAGSFLGVISDGDPITQVDIFEQGGGAEGIDNLIFASIRADLSLEKTCEVDAGTRTASFHLDLTNAGPSGTSDVLVTDWLPGATSVTAWTSTQGGFDPDSGVWDVGDVAAGTTVSLWIDVDLLGQGRFENRAEVTASSVDDPDSTPGDGTGDDYDACAFIVLGDRVVPDFVPEQSAGGVVDRGDRFVADLTLDKSVNVDSAPVGGEVHYIVDVRNLGPHSAAKVEVTDHLPECLTDVTSTATRGSYDLWTWVIGKVKVGETVRLEVWATVGPDCSGTVVNTAEVTASSLPDPDDQFNIFDDPPVEDEIDSAEFDVEAGAAGRLSGTTFALGENYPNPFNPETLIPFSVAEASHVAIKVYDLLGRVVATLVDGSMAAGVHEVRFEGSSLPTGMYLVRMEAAGIVKTMRVTLMK